MTKDIDENLPGQFIGWQCRIRQHSVRKQEGRPAPGMRPALFLNGESVGAIIVLIIKAAPEEITTEFRFMAKKTQDPRIRYDNAIKFLSEYYYQRPAEFDDEMTAVFSVDSELARKIINSEDCRLDFEQANQTYRLPCQTRLLHPGDEKYEATYWHNYLFNPEMPGKVAVLGFQPVWELSEG